MATVVDGDFERDADKALANQRKHGVSFVEAATVFEDPHALDAPDLETHERFVILGRSRLSRMLFVVHCERGRRVRIIRARVASRAQERLYEEGP